MYGVCPGNDFYGGDLPAPHTYTPANSLTDCIEACTKTKGCVAAAFTLGVCYIKGTQNDASVNNNVDSIYKISGAVNSSVMTGTGVCFGGTGPKSIHTASNGDVYGICSGNDFWGGDMQNGVSTADLNACNEACSKQVGCIAVAFTYGTCWLKNIRNPVSLNINVDAAYKLASESQTTATTVPTTEVSLMVNTVVSPADFSSLSTVDR